MTATAAARTAAAAVSAAAAARGGAAGCTTSSHLPVIPKPYTDDMGAVTVAAAVFAVGVPVDVALLPARLLAELRALEAVLADPGHSCDACGGGLPGVLCPAGNDEHHLFVQSCDNCAGAGQLDRGHSDDEWAARTLAARIGWTVHHRWDGPGMTTWRPLVAEPGSWDDRDWVGVAGDGHGWGPEQEIPLWVGWPRDQRPDRPASSHRRIQLRRTRGWRKPGGTVVVSRPSRLGNRFQIGELSREQSVALYLCDLVTRLADPDPGNDELREAIRAIRGKDVACWCPLEDGAGGRVVCHGDVVLAVANGPELWPAAGQP